MKARIYVVTKYVVAETLAQAVAKEKRLPPDAVYLDECSVKAVGDELVEQAKDLSTRSRSMKKNARAVH